MLAPEVSGGCARHGQAEKWSWRKGKLWHPLALTHLRPLTGQLRKCLDGVSIIIYFSWPSPFLKANEGKMRNVQGKKYFDRCHTTGEAG